MAKHQSAHKSRLDRTVLPPPQSPDEQTQERGDNREREDERVYALQIYDLMKLWLHIQLLQMMLCSIYT
jgi:hypothetical protein